MDIEVASVDDAAAVIKAQLDQAADLLTTYANAQVGAIEEFNAKLLLETRQILEGRLTHLDATKAAVATIGIPLVPRVGAPQLPIALDQKIEIYRAASTDGDAARAVPTIRDADYENILSLIRHQCRTFEGAPAAFGALDEEHLRDVIRACLCAVYRGAAAEAFRSKGKTDICIEADDRSAFVTECKIWSGGKALLEALDQLLGYLIWRDCKTAVVVFNKTVQKFGELAEGKVIAQIQSHPGYVRTILSNAKDGEWRIVLRHSDGHEVLCHVMLYNLFSS